MAQLRQGIGCHRRAGKADILGRLHRALQRHRKPGLSFLLLGRECKQRPHRFTLEHATRGRQQLLRRETRRSEEATSELQSLMPTPYAVFFLKIILFTIITLSSYTLMTTRTITY